MTADEFKANGGGSRLLLLLLLICTATTAAYYQVFYGGFISYDDAVYVIENYNIKTGISLESIRWALLTKTDGNWFPITWLSYMLDIVVADPSPRTFHISNLLYHLANSSLLLVALYLMTGHVYRSAIVAALFALHPLHVESVAWISERKDLMSGFFLMLTLIAYTKYRQQQNVARYLVTLVLFACGLMSKPMLVTLPLLLLLLDYWPLKKYDSIFSRKFRLLALEKIPFFILSIASAIITYNVQKHKAVVSYAESSLLTNVKNAAVSYVMYIYKTFVPTKLAVIYPFQADISTLKVLTAGLLIVAVSLWVIVKKKEKPYLLVGWCWYIIALLPVIGIIRVGKQSMADRYAYIPHIGFFILLVWWASESSFINKIGSKVKIIAVVCLLLVLTTLTWRQTGRWKTSLELFTHTVDVTENNWVALGVLGFDYITSNDLDKALLVLNKSLSLNPKNTMALFNMGVLQNKLGNRGVALEHFRRVVAIEPDYRMAHYQIGLQLLYGGDTVGALAEYNILLDLDPDLARQLMSSILIRNN